MLKLTLKAPTTGSNSTAPSNNSTAPSSNSTAPSNNPITPKITINLTPTTQPQQPTPPATDLEEHFILRLPPSLASLLTDTLLESAFTSPGDLKIRFASPRTALVQHPRFIKPAYPALLCDSPSILETLKNPTISVEFKSSSLSSSSNSNSSNTATSTTAVLGQYYKVADLNQILVVLDVDSPEGQGTLSRLPAHIQQRLLLLATAPDSFEAIKSAIPAGQLAEEAASSSLSWCSLSDGLTPPLKNAQRRRFAPRPVHAAEIGNLERVEREVERLLKADGHCEESHFTLIGVDGVVLLGDSVLLDNHEDDQEQVQEFEDFEEEQEQEEEEDNDNDDDSMLEQGQGEFEESEDSDVMDDFAAEIEDNLMRLEAEDENEVGSIATTASAPSTKNTASNAPSSVSSSSLSSSTPSATATQTHTAVTELESKLQEKLKQAATVTNPLIKARIEDVIRQLEDNLRKLREREGEADQ
jgi:TATA-binding protein-associated factor Taf7